MALLLKKFDEQRFTREKEMIGKEMITFGGHLCQHLTSKNGLYEIYRALTNSFYCYATFEFWYEEINTFKRLKRVERNYYNLDGVKEYISETMFNYTESSEDNPIGLLCQEEICGYFIIDGEPKLVERSISLYFPDGDDVTMCTFTKCSDEQNATMKVCTTISLESLKKAPCKECQV